MKKCVICFGADMKKYWLMQANGGSFCCRETSEMSKKNF